MALTLNITKSPQGSQLAESSKIIGPEGCFIGRGADNDWVLSDPERFLSSKHCHISCENGAYYITDTSTNGTFLNDAAEPLGRGGRSELKSGDTFELGDYRFEAEIATENAPFGVSAPAQDPFGASPFGDDDFLAAPSQADATPFFDEPKANDGLSDLVSAAKDDIVDPLAALDGISPSPPQQRPADAAPADLDPLAGLGASEADPFSADPVFGESMSSGGDVMTDNIDWPEPKQDDGLIPDDWDDDLSILNARKPQRQPFQLPDDESLIVNKAAAPAPSPKPGAGRTASPARVPSPRRGGAAPSGRPAPAAETRREPPTPQPNSVSGGSSRRLVDALGLDDANLSEEQIADIELKVAEMMRETLGGLMQVLRSRSSIKNEFRMNVTTIQPVENNPLKFSANVDEVLEIMFVRNKNKAYKEPLEAITESFQTIADHQMAVIAGIRSAFEGVMQKFDPLVLEDGFKQAGKSSLLAAVGKGKYWSAYQEYYQKVVNDMESSFQEFFGDEFVHAYEDQLRKLADARRRRM